MTEEYEVKSDYLHKYLSPIAREERVRLAVDALLPHVPYFDTIAVRGVSGLVIGSVVADRLKKSIAVVRKGESTHSPHMVEGKQSCVFVFVDDLIYHGVTLREVKKMVEFELKGRCYGAFVFDGYEKLPIDGVHDVTTFAAGSPPNSEVEAAATPTMPSTPETRMGESSLPGTESTGCSSGADKREVRRTQRRKAS